MTLPLPQGMVQPKYKALKTVSLSAANVGLKFMTNGHLSLAYQSIVYINLISC